MTQEGMKRKLAAILSADVEGYSRLMGEDEVGTIRTLTAYKEAMSSLIQEYKGRVVDAPGDNLLAEFGSVVDAVNCSVQIQRDLAERNAELPYGRRMEFRIGINLGDIIEEGETIYGDGVNIAARIEGLAEAGGVCVSRNVYDQVKTRVPLDYTYLGEHAVKNISEPVRVYRINLEPDGNLQESSWECGLPEKPSIAVLPFVNMSGDPEQEYFSDGMTEEIITGLSKTSNLFVIARNSTFTYKGKPVKVQRVGRELGVKYVLEGSVRKAGARVRITAQLVDANTGHHIWADRYDRDLEDIFALQDEMTMKIMTELRVQLTEGDQAALQPKGARNLDAYLKYLQALEYRRRFTAEDNVRARKTAEEAIALDANYQGGYSVLASVEISDVWLGISKSPQESLMRAIELARKAIAIEDSYDPHRALAQAYVLFRKYDEAISEAKKALEMMPSSADAHWTLGHVFMLADMPYEAVPVLEKGIRLNPFPPSSYFHNLAFSYCNMGRLEEAIAAAKKALRVNPNDILARCAMVASYSFLNREEEARAEAAEVLKIDPQLTVERVRRTSPLKNQEKLERILDALAKSGFN